MPEDNRAITYVEDLIIEEYLREQKNDFARLFHTATKNHFPAYQRIRQISPLSRLILIDTDASFSLPPFFDFAHHNHFQIQPSQCEYLDSNVTKRKLAKDTFPGIITSGKNLKKYLLQGSDAKIGAILGLNVSAQNEILPTLENITSPDMFTPNACALFSFIENSDYLADIPIINEAIEARQIHSQPMPAFMQTYFMYETHGDTLYHLVIGK